MSNELLQLIKDSEKERLKILSEASTDERDKETKRYEFQKEEIKKMEDYKALLKQDRRKVDEALEKQHQSELTKIEFDEFKKRVALAAQFGALLGTATAKMLRGEKDAWKDMLSSVIDMMAQQAQAAIIINGLEGYSAELKKGVVGFATGAVILAETVAKAAAVAGIAELAKGAIAGGGGGGVSSPAAAGGGGGFATTTATTPPEAAPERKQATVQVNITGDLYGEPAFVDRLAEKISSAVENRDVRLIATGGK